MTLKTTVLDIWDQIGGMPPRSAKGLTLDTSGFVTELRTPRRLSYPDADTAAGQAAMQRNELVYSCIDVKANAAQDPRLVVQQLGAKGAYEEQPGHPFRQLLMRPNPEMTEADLMQAAIVSWDISNPRRFFCEKEMKGNLLVALWPLNPAYMRPLMSRADSRTQIGYVWGDGVATKEYSFDDLLVRRAPAWYDPPPIVAALGNVDLDTAQTDIVRSFFANGGIPPGLIKYKNITLRQDQRDAVRERWRASYGNAFGRSMDIGVIDAEMEYQEIGSQLDKLANVTLRSISESRVCMCFGVPPLIIYAYVGLLRATYSNLKEAWAGFWDATMSPSFKEWRNFWTWHLLTEFEDEQAIRSERVKLAYDLSAVAALQEDVDSAQARAEKAWRAGGITRAEYRQALGQQPDASKDNFYLLPTGVQVVTADQGAATKPDAPAKSAVAAEPSPPILGYHIEQGIVSKNEARAQLGLPQEDDTRDQMLRQLQSTLAVLQAAINAQIPIEVALPLVGLDLTLPDAPADVPPQLMDGKRAAKARTSAGVQAIERRMEKAVRAYLTDEYRKAAAAVGG